jgi:hypothetical protein
MSEAIRDGPCNITSSGVPKIGRCCRESIRIEGEYDGSDGTLRGGSRACVVSLFFDVLDKWVLEIAVLYAL